MGVLLEMTMNFFKKIALFREFHDNAKLGGSFLVESLFELNDVIATIRCQYPNLIESVISIFFFHFRHADLHS